MIQTQHFNWLPRQSAWGQLQAQRAQQAEYQNFADFSSAIAGSFNDAMANQYAGIGNLAADAAAKRLGITLPSQSSTPTTTSSSSSSSTSSTDSSSSSTASADDYMKTINQIINGTSGLASEAQSAISSAGSAQAAIANMLDGANIGGTPSATVNQIINGTAGLANSAQSQMSSDGNMFSTIDRIINSKVNISV